MHRSIERALLARAKELEADLFVMDDCGRSRVHERISVHGTSHVLDPRDGSILIAH
jgi:hypothetical protein